MAPNSLTPRPDHHRATEHQAAPGSATYNAPAMRHQPARPVVLHLDQGEGVTRGSDEKRQADEGHGDHNARNVIGKCQPDLSQRCAKESTTAKHQQQGDTCAVCGMTIC
jgi:hypothetical protein